MNAETLRTDPKFSFLGVGLIFIGLLLLLNHLDLFQMHWSKSAWPLLAILGGWIALRGYAVGKRSSVFTGSVLLFVSVFGTLKRFAVISFGAGDWIPAVSLSIGLAFLALLFFEPRNLLVLVPMMVFGGFGVMYYLWWMDLVSGVELRYFVKRYWPVLLILYGLAFALPRKRQL